MIHLISNLFTRALKTKMIKLDISINQAKYLTLFTNFNAVNKKITTCMLLENFIKNNHPSDVQLIIDINKLTNQMNHT